jgi:hypothetical protein
MLPGNHGERGEYVHLFVECIVLPLLASGLSLQGLKVTFTALNIHTSRPKRLQTKLICKGAQEANNKKGRRVDFQKILGTGSSRIENALRHVVIIVFPASFVQHPGRCNS